MKLGFVKIGIVVLASVLPATPAHPQTDAPGLSPWWFTLRGGAMFPSGDEGSGLEMGPDLNGTIGYERSQYFVLGGDLGYVSSGDPTGTSIALLGGHVRMNPNRYLETLYVQGGGAVYRVAHDRGLAGLAPPNKFRPGLSFGVGYEFASHATMALGVVGMYHGIVIARSDALSYLTLGLTLSFRPGRL